MDARFASLPDYPLEDLLALKKRFPPRMLKGMSSWTCWLPPKLWNTFDEVHLTPKSILIASRQGAVMSWLETLHKFKEELAARDDDPWRLPLERIRGQIGDDGLERVTTQMLLDVLDLPQRSRKAGTYKRLAKLMAELGWMAVRVRGLTRGGYLEQVRGYCRQPIHRS